MVTGGFDPIHPGHVRLFEEAKKLGDKLVVVINNDNWICNKKGYGFMSEKDRAEVISAFRCVDEVIISNHQLGKKNSKDMSVCEDIKRVKPHVFANGGDRDEKNAQDPNSSLYWDIKLCEELNIQMVFGVGKGGKINSSSWLLNSYLEKRKNNKKVNVA